MNLKDQILLRKIRKGDIQAFKELFHTHYAGMMRYAAVLVGKEEVAEGVVQDVFYNIWKNHGSLKILKSWQSYLYRSVYNNSMMVLRKKRREQYLEDSIFTEPASESPDPLEELAWSETSERVSRAIGELPARTREIFLLNRQEGLKYREVAEQLQISVKTVEANMGKALAALRESLKYDRQP